MNNTFAPNTDLTRLLTFVVDHLDIPKSLYEKAAGRHRSLADWLQRKESKLAEFDPDIRPQGSFRYGTVNRPLRDDDQYDLDNVCLLRRLGKGKLTQQQLKELYGEEIKGYAKANSMLAPVEEKNRCWRLVYADEVNFHLDTLPCVPEDPAVVQRIMAAAVSEELARRSVAITDKRHPRYRVVTPDWLSSNPRGFATWFEQRAALGRRTLREGLLRASVENVPPYEWKTTLQQSIQLLKRHRDVMFRKTPDVAPISMIVTNLAAHAYQGEADLGVALRSIIDRMPNFVLAHKPRVPNPADPAEDYADKWARDPRLEENFWGWYWAVKRDVEELVGVARSSTAADRVWDRFQVRLKEDEVRQLRPVVAVPPVAKAAPTIVIPSGPRPWGR